MIQRIQSVWLLLAALISVCLFVFDITTATYLVQGATQKMGVELWFYPYYLPAIAIFMIILPLFAITQFKNRGRQKLISIISIILNIGFIVVLTASLDKFTDFSKYQREAVSYNVVSFLPLFSIIFLILAIRGINKDEKLVKSLDRLR